MFNLDATVSAPKMLTFNPPVHYKRNTAKQRHEQHAALEKARAERVAFNPNHALKRKTVLQMERRWLKQQTEERKVQANQGCTLLARKKVLNSAYAGPKFTNADSFMGALRSNKFVQCGEPPNKIDQVGRVESGGSAGSSSSDSDSEPSLEREGKDKRAQKGAGSHHRAARAVSLPSLHSKKPRAPADMTLARPLPPGSKGFNTHVKKLASHVSIGELGTLDSGDKSSSSTNQFEAARKISYTCKDSLGRVFDVKELRNRRLDGVMRGISYMHQFLRKHKYRNLHSIGDDAPSIFFEMWYTSADSRVRTNCRAIAAELLEQLEKKVMAKTEYSRDDFFEIMYLLRIKHEMELPHEELLERADTIYVALDFSNTDEMFDVPLCQLNDVKTGPWLMLLMRILIVEYNNLIFPKRFPVLWGLKHAFLALRQHRLTGPNGGDNFHDSFFLATHICYALSAYCATKTKENEVKWLWKYLRTSLKYWMGEARLREKEHAKAKAEGVEPPFRYVDIDGVAEVIDVLRGCGKTPAGDTLICEATVWLLDTQRKCGSWPLWFNHGKGEGDSDTSAYDLLHPTWVATQALRDRDFKLLRHGNQLWDKWVHKLVKQTDFNHLEYEAPWMKSRKKK